MKVFIASDHAGYTLKEKIKEYLVDYKYDFIDFGTNSNTSVDYPDFAFKVGESVADVDGAMGILICKTGIGMSIACNKVKGIRCAKVDSVEEANLSRAHNNANVIAISADKDKQALDIVKEFLNTTFSHVERHVQRVSKISKYEDKNEY